MSFYGDPTIKNLLQFDKTYSSRKDMEDAIVNGNDDGVFLNRFVFVRYSEGSNYDSCYQKDMTKYGNTYDGTFWKKVSNGGVVKYELISNLNPDFLIWHTF